MLFRSDPPFRSHLIPILLLLLLCAIPLYAFVRYVGLPTLRKLMAVDKHSLPDEEKIPLTSMDESDYSDSSSPRTMSPVTLGESSHTFASKLPKALLRSHSEEDWKRWKHTDSLLLREQGSSPPAALGRSFFHDVPSAEPAWSLSYPSPPPQYVILGQRVVNRF